MSINDIKFDHFKSIEELIQHLEMWYAEDDYDAYNRFFGLRDARIMGMIIYQLTNNWNELEKWCQSWKDNDKYCYLSSSDIDKCRYTIWEEVLDKMNEIKKA